MSGGIHCLVFSKDRAMQLDAFLRSAERYAPYDDVYALVYFQRERSYDLTVRDHPHVGWWDQEFNGGFETSVRKWLSDKERVVFHTDDDVFYRPASIFDVCYSVPPNEWPPSSFRLGKNTTYCHPLDCEQEPPAHFPWRWREAQGDFGYPLCLNATVYQSADLLPLLQGWHFQNPTELEAGLAYRAELFRPEWMTAPLHSCCVSLPHNRVSSSSGCRTGTNPLWQPDSLRDLYLDGYRIDLDRMDFTDIVGAHQEVPLAFTRRKG